MPPNLKTIAKEMAKFAASIGEVKVEAGSEHPNGVWRFYASLPEVLSKDTDLP